MLLGAFGATVVAFFGLLGEHAQHRHETMEVFDWIPAVGVKMAFLVDPLSMTMALFVTGVGSLIHLFAIGYMHGDPRFNRFFLYLNMFLVSMLLLVLGDNFLVTVPRLGGRGDVLVPAHLVLVRAGVGGHRREEGLHHQPGR